MEVNLDTPKMSPCGQKLPNLEVPMMNTLVTCLGSEHRKLGELNMQLALAASRLASDPSATPTNQHARELWDEIRLYLWSHLQIEDEVVFEWGEAHHGIPGTLLETLKNERQEMRKLIAALHLPDTGDPEQPNVNDQSNFAETLLALTQMLDAHVERYDGEVLPSILRALFQK